METDRELLELAAKAAGYGGVRPTTFDNDTYMAHINGDWIPWNPHSLPGDALCLAVLLDMTLRFYGNACAQATRPGGPAVYETVEYHTEGSRIGAACRAILRCAAEIGKASHV